jgi:hypothetical protein
MMGMVYTELLDMVEQRYSVDMVDAILDRAGLTGSYTSVGSYSDAELFALVGALSAESGVPADELLYAFGSHLFGRFVELFPGFFAEHDSALSFVHRLENHVHTEVRKLYPNADPARFTVTDTPDGGLYLDYRSPRALHRFAEGLLDQTLTHFGGTHRRASSVDLSEGQGTHVRFHIVAVDAHG